MKASTAMFNFIHNGGDSWLLGVQRFGTTSDPNANYGLIGNNASATANTGFWFGFADAAGIPRNNGITCQVSRAVGGSLVLSNTADNVLTPNQTKILNSQFDSDNATAANRNITWVDNGSAIQNNVQTNAVNLANASFNLQWGAIGNAAIPITGSLQRLVIWNANLSTQRTTLITLTNSYYGAY